MKKEKNNQNLKNEIIYTIEFVFLIFIFLWVSNFHIITIIMALIFMLFFIIINLFKENKIKQLKIYIILVSILVLLWLYILKDSIISLIFLIILILIILNSFFKDMFKIETIVIIVLTILILESSYPIVKSRVEILNIGEINYCKINNEINQEGDCLKPVIVSITPPLILPLCTTVGLDWDIKDISWDKSIYGINIFKTKDKEKLLFCNKFLDFTKRTIKFYIYSKQPLNYEHLYEYVDRLSWINGADSSVRIFESLIRSDEPFPISFNGNISFIINRTSLFDEKTKLLDFIYRYNETSSCKMGNFTISLSKDNRFGNKCFSNAKNDSILLKCPINLYFYNASYQNLYLKFYPYYCH